MKNHGKTLTDRMYDSVRRGIGALAVAGLGYIGLNYLLPSKADAQEVTRVTETENFDADDSGVAKSNIRNPTDKWDVGLSSKELECQEYADGSTGYLFFHFNDKLYNFKTGNLCVEVDSRKDKWSNDVDKDILVIAGSPTDNTYYLFAINAHHVTGGKWWIYSITPGLESLLYLGGKSDVILKGGTNKLSVSYDATNGYNFKVNDNDKFLTDDEKISINSWLPFLEGYTGVGAEDTNEKGDPSLTSIFYFDNHKAIYDSGGGGAAKDLRIPHKPEFFIRGDANRDFKLGVADAITILNYLFRYENEFKCYEAMDVNDDGRIDIVDPVKLLLNQFVGGINTPKLDPWEIPPPNMGGGGLDLDISKYENGRIVGLETLNCDDGLSPE